MSVWRTVIDQFRVPGGLAVERIPEASMVGGYAEETAGDKYLLDPVALHPASGRDMRLLEEGERTEQWLVLYALDRLRTTRDPEGGQADRLSLIHI